MYQLCTSGQMLMFKITIWPIADIVFVFVYFVFVVIKRWYFPSCHITPSSLTLNHLFDLLKIYSYEGQCCPHMGKFLIDDGSQQGKYCPINHCIFKINPYKLKLCFHLRLSAGLRKNCHLILGEFRDRSVKRRINGVYLHWPWWRSALSKCPSSFRYTQCFTKK